MGKYGNKITVANKTMSDYMIGFMAPSGFGKSTTMYQMCDKLYGDEGYILLDIGSEDGVSAIEGVVAEKAQTWKKLREIVDDIVKNKETDYPNLKVVILDTLDATFEIAESAVIKAWNSENMGQQNFKPATSINPVEGGFGKGLDRVIETVKKEITKLDSVGVKVWWTAHVKEKDQIDLFSGAAYTTLTANMPIKYFNSIKNISHVIGFGYFDRSVEAQEVGEANPVTHKKKTRKAVTDETRKVKFRDSSLIADAKSRFKNIVEEINLDANEFIKAIEDAISAEHSNSATKAPIKKKAEEKPKHEPESEIELDIEEDIIDPSDLVEKIKVAFKATSDKTIKLKVKDALGGNKLSVNVPIDTLLEIANILDV